MDVSAIINDLNDHGFTDSSTERKLAIINEVYWDVCGRMPWPFLEKTVQLSFDGVNPVPVNVPSDFHAVVTCNVNSVGGPVVQPMRYDDWLARNNQLNNHGVPLNYYFTSGLQFSFYPIPPVSTTLTMQYICTPPALSAVSLEADILLPREYHRSCLVNGAIYRLDAMEDDLDIASGFQSFYEAAIARMQEWLWRRQWQAPEVIHPVDLDDLGGGGSWDISTGWAG